MYWSMFCKINVSLRLLGKLDNICIYYVIGYGMDNKEFTLIEFEKLSPYTAKYGNIFFAYDILCEFSFLEYKATLLPLFDKKNVGTDAMAILFAIKVENSLWYLGMEKKDWILFHHAVTNKQELQHSYNDFFPLELQQIIAEDFIVPYLEKLGQLLDCPISLVRSYLDEFKNISLSSSCISCEMQIKNHEENCIYQSLLYFFIPEEMASIHLLDKIKKILPSMPKAESFLEKQKILLPISFCIGETVVELNDFDLLAIGDFILFDTFYGKNNCIRIYPHYFLLKNHENFAFFDKEYIFCLVEDKNIQVKEWVKLSEGKDYMEENENNAEFQKEQYITATKQADISSLGLAIHFELEQRMISLEELQAIKPGYTFALNVDLLAPVNLIVNGKTIGKGKIVDINGVFGVQVTEFYNKKNV